MDDELEITTEKGVFDEDNGAKKTCKGYTTGYSTGATSGTEMDELKKANQELLKRLAELEKKVGRRDDDRLVKWIDINKYCKSDMKSAAVYLAQEIAPKVKDCMGMDETKFVAMKSIMGEGVQMRSTLRICTNYNQGRNCNYSKNETKDCHADKMNFRIHGCQLCWELFGAIVLHRVLECRFLRQAFWQEMEIDHEIY